MNSIFETQIGKMANADVTIKGEKKPFGYHHSFLCWSISEIILQRLMDQQLSGDFSSNKTLWLEWN